jgi:hypothetical protein
MNWRGKSTCFESIEQSGEVRVGRWKESLNGSISTLQLPRSCHGGLGAASGRKFQGCGSRQKELWYRKNNLISKGQK